MAGTEHKAREVRATVGIGPAHLAVIVVPPASHRVVLAQSAGVAATACELREVRTSVGIGAAHLPIIVPPPADHRPVMLDRRETVPRILFLT